MFFALTALEEYWAKNEKIVFLGEWCKRWSRRNHWQKVDHETVPFVWDDVGKIEEAYRYCQSLYPRVLDEITALLNKIHGTAYPSRYFHVLLGNWALQFMHQAYDKFVVLDEAVKLYPGCWTTTTAEEDEVVPVDVDDYFSLVVNDHYAHQMYSQLIRSQDLLTFRTPVLRPPSARAIAAPRKPSGSRIRRWGFGLASGISRILWKERFITVTEPNIAYNESWHLFHLVLRSRFRVAIDAMGVPSGLPIAADLHARRQERLQLGTSAFEQCLETLLPRHLPIAFWEGYKTCRNAADLRSRSTGKALFTATALHGNTLAKFVVAGHGEQIRILNMIHGGGYGLDLLHMPEEFERSVASICYGGRWILQKGGRFLPNGKICALVHSVNRARASLGKTRRQHILYSINEFPRYLYRFQFHLTSSGCVKVGLADSVAFIRELRYRAAIRIRIHPEPELYGWDLGARLKEHFPDLQPSDLSVRFDEALARCRLFVTGQQGTTLYEALAANVPTICFLNPKVYRFCSSARLFLDDLASCGILHSTPESAAHFANARYEHIEQWWDSAQVQSARMSFVDEYVPYDPDWVEAWVRECERVLASP